MSRPMSNGALGLGVFISFLGGIDSVLTSRMALMRASKNQQYASDLSCCPFQALWRREPVTPPRGFCSRAAMCWCEKFVSSIAREVLFSCNIIRISSLVISLLLSVVWKMGFCEIIDRAYSLRVPVVATTHFYRHFLCNHATYIMIHTYRPISIYTMID